MGGSTSGVAAYTRSPGVRNAPRSRNGVDGRSKVGPFLHHQRRDDPQVAQLLLDGGDAIARRFQGRGLPAILGLRRPCADRATGCRARCRARAGCARERRPRRSGVSLAVAESRKRPMAWPTFPLSNDNVTRSRAGRSSSSGLPETNTIWRGTRVSSLVASMAQPLGSSLRYGRGVSWISAFTSPPLPSSVLTSLKVRRVALARLVEAVDRKPDEHEVAVVVAARAALGKRGVGQRLESEAGGSAGWQGDLDLVLVASRVKARGEHRAVGLSGQRRGAGARLRRHAASSRPTTRRVAQPPRPACPASTSAPGVAERGVERGQFRRQRVARGGLLGRRQVERRFLDPVVRPRACRAPSTRRCRRTRAGGSSRAARTGRTCGCGTARTRPSIPATPWPSCSRGRAAPPIAPLRRRCRLPD